MSLAFYFIMIVGLYFGGSIGWLKNHWMGIGIFFFCAKLKFSHLAHCDVVELLHLC